MTLPELTEQYQQINQLAGQKRIKESFDLLEKLVKECSNRDLAQQLEKHKDTYRHMLMVFALYVFFGNYLIPDFKKRIQEAAAGPTHDIGKTNGVKKVTPTYCLGCNLMMLNHIWDYNQDSRNKSSVGIVNEAKRYHDINELSKENK